MAKEIRMASTSTATKPKRREVTVIVDQQPSHPQPTTFNLCPLGIQFYSSKPMEEFHLLELDVDVSDEHGNSRKITCKGAVVRCQREPEPDRYRIWLKFIDLPEGARESIRCAAKDGQHLCSYCENF